MKLWVSVTDRLSIGPDPRGLAVDTAMEAVVLIEDGERVCVPDDATAFVVLIILGVEFDQAMRQIRWAQGKYADDELLQQ